MQHMIFTMLAFGSFNDKSLTDGCWRSKSIRRVSLLCPQNFVSHNTSLNCVCMFFRLGAGQLNAPQTPFEAVGEKLGGALLRFFVGAFPRVVSDHQTSRIIVYLPVHTRFVIPMFQLNSDYYY